jgi:hypothetical protein
MSSEPKKTRVVCECKELDEEGNVLRTFPMSSTSENLKRQRRGVSTWNEQLKTVAALMKEALRGEKAPSGIQLKIAKILKDQGKIDNPTLEDVRKAMEQVQGVAPEKSNVRAPPISPKREPVELEDDSDEEKGAELVANNSKEETLVANNSTEKSRMQKQGGGSCGCAGGSDVMKGGAGCGMWPASGGKRRGARKSKTSRKTRKTRKTKKSRKASMTRRRK